MKLILKWGMLLYPFPCLAISYATILDPIAGFSLAFLLALLFFSMQIKVDGMPKDKGPRIPNKFR